MPGGSAVRAEEGLPTTMAPPASRTITSENFPVISRWLPTRLRPPVAAFYALARAMDDITDHPHLSPAEKLRALDRYAVALDGADIEGPALPEATDVRNTLAAMGVTRRHCRDLISAFRQDALQSRYDTWDELMDYCDRSAAPIGRFLIDLHGESPVLYEAADALCRALQIINHLQDCADDYRTLDRVYLPQAWLKTMAVEESALGADRSTRALRTVMDRCLDATDQLLVLAARLPARIRGVRFRTQTAVTLCIAERLSAALRQHDPLAKRVVLTPTQYLGCGLRGVIRMLAASIPPGTRPAVRRTRSAGRSPW